MKQLLRPLFILTASILLLSQTACIEDGEVLQADVPRVVMDTFKDHFPGATNAQWQYEDHIYEVEFAYYGEHWMAVIDCDGLLRDSYSLGESEYDGRQTNNDNPRKPPARSN